METVTTTSAQRKLLKEHIREKMKNLPSRSDTLDAISDGRYTRVAVYFRSNKALDSMYPWNAYPFFKYYCEDLIRRQAGWTLVRCYFDWADTERSTRAFEEMMQDCEAGKIDLIFTRSISRFAPNIRSCAEAVRKLSALTPPVGVYFEIENIYTLTSLAMFTEERVRCLEAEKARSLGYAES